MLFGCLKNKLVDDQWQQTCTNLWQSQRGTNSKQEYAHCFDTSQPQMNSFLNVVKLPARKDYKVLTCMLNFCCGIGHNRIQCICCNHAATILSKCLLLCYHTKNDSMALGRVQ